MKATTLFLLLFVLTGLIFAQEQYQTASDAIKNNDYKKALSIARDFLNHDSTDQAIKVLVELTAHDSTEKGPFESLGDAYSKMSVLELALENYNRAQSIDSLDLPLKMKIAETLYKQKSYTEAANKYLEVIARDTTDIVAYEKLGELLYYAKQYPNAAFYLSKYLTFDHNNSKAYQYDANAFFLAHDYEEAAKEAKEGLQYFPQLNELKRIVALSFIYLKKSDDAIQYVVTTPDSLFSGREFYQIGAQLRNDKKDSLSYIYLKKAMNKDTAYVGSISESLANSYLTAGRYDSAIVYYNMKLKVDSTSVSTHINKAMCLIQLKNYAEARVSLIDAIQLKSDNLTSHKYLAMTYRLMDSLEAATAEYKNIIKLAEADEDKYKNELAEAYGFFGYSDLVKKRYPSAIENIKSAISYTPENIQYHVWLAQAYALGSRTEDAIREYRKVLQMDPRNPDAKKGLKILGE